MNLDEANQSEDRQSEEASWGFTNATPIRRAAQTSEERALVLNSLPDDMLTAFLERMVSDKKVDWLRAALDNGNFRLSLVNDWREDRLHDRESRGIASLTKILNSSTRDTTSDTVSGERVVMPPFRTMRTSEAMRDLFSDVVQSFLTDARRYISEVENQDIDQERAIAIHGTVLGNAAILLAIAAGLNDVAACEALLDEVAGCAKEHISYKAMCLVGGSKDMKLEPWIAAFEYGSTDCLDLFAKRGIKAEGDIGILYEPGNDEDEPVTLGQLLSCGLMDVRADTLTRAIASMTLADGNRSDEHSSPNVTWDMATNYSFVLGLRDRSLTDLNKTHWVPELLSAGVYDDDYTHAVSQALKIGDARLFEAYANDLPWEGYRSRSLAGEVDQDPENRIVGPMPLNAALPKAKLKGQISLPVPQETRDHFDSVALKVVQEYRARGVLDAALFDYGFGTGETYDRPAYNIVKFGLERTLADLLQHGLDPSSKLPITALRNPSEEDLSLIEFATLTGAEKMASMMRSQAALNLMGRLGLTGAESHFDGVDTFRAEKPYGNASQFDNVARFEVVKPLGTESHFDNAGPFVKVDHSDNAGHSAVAAGAGRFASVGSNGAGRAFANEGTADGRIGNGKSLVDETTLGSETSVGNGTPLVNMTTSAGRIESEVVVRNREKRAFGRSSASETEGVDVGVAQTKRAFSTFLKRSP